MLKNTLRISILSLSLILLTGCDLLNLFVGNSILVVDLNAVAKATGQSDQMQKELELANLQLTEQLKLVASQLEEKITDKKDELGKSPSESELQDLQTYVLQAQQQLANTKNLAIQQSSEFRSDLILRFRSDVQNITKEIASNANSKVVLVSNQETIWFDPSTDITDEVISIMRARGFNPSTEEVSNTNKVE